MKKDDRYWRSYVNRPKALNALNEQVFNELMAAMEELRGKKT